MGSLKNKTVQETSKEEEEVEEPNWWNFQIRTHCVNSTYKLSYHLNGKNRFLIYDITDLYGIFFNNINTDLYDIALKLQEDQSELAVTRDVHNDTALHVLARKPSSMFAPNSIENLKMLTYSTAFTVCGGNNDKIGIPFRVFDISATIALSSSLISILMFPSILTLGYTKMDLKMSLPLKLIGGLGALFISVIGMMITLGRGKIPYKFFLMMRGEANQSWRHTENSLKIVFMPGCKRCGAACETIAHALLVCPKAAAVWEAFSFGLLFVAAHVPSLFDFLCSFSQVLPRRDFELVCIILWQLWFERNYSLHNGKLKAVADILSASVSRSNNGAGISCVEEGNREVVRWAAPPASSLKLNCDAAVRADRACIGIRAVTRSSSEQVVVASSKVLPWSFSPQIGEFLTLSDGLVLALQQKLKVA
ncbi:hypothetical protein ACOSQ4_003182 [Xanthoceras sorbifolium]